MARVLSFLVLVAAFLLGGVSHAAEGTNAAEMRFPAPEFKSGYSFPGTTVPDPTPEWQAWVDVALLAGCLALASWLAVKRHSRRGLFILMCFSLLYFGFYKRGCVCPIGSIQNVALAIFNPYYALPVSVLLTFLLPLVFALFYGRVFCSSVCALGAIQDLVALRPLPLSRRVTIGLSVIPYAYLGLSLLLAATDTGFLICRFDPFIGFFRLTGNAPYLWLGAGFLLVGVVIARPYCRFFCPYGVLLGWMSTVSRKHVNITPTSCVNCRLCETSCPFDYIHKPNITLARESRRTGVRRLGLLFVMLPVLILLCGWTGHRLSVPLSRYNSQVALAEQLVSEQARPSVQPSLEVRTFRSKGTPEPELIAHARMIRTRMDRGGWLFGAATGLVIGLKLIRFSTFRMRTEYEIDRTHCFSCARCCTHCPNDPRFTPNFLPDSPAWADARTLAAAPVPTSNPAPQSLNPGKS